MPGKRLFWIAIIVVELVCVYVLWKPVRNHFMPQRHVALNSPAERPAQKRQPEVRQPEVRQPEVRHPQTESSRLTPAPRKPSGAIARSPLPARRKIVVNAGLRTPEPIPAPAPPPTPPLPAAGSLADSFWCHISRVETTTCDCKTKEADQAATLVTR